MRVAIPIWDGRISPVFDVARRVLLVEVEGEGESSRREEVMDDADFGRRADRVANLGVDVLICGAISWPLEGMLASKGVRVIPQTCGEAEHVLRAFLSGRLTERSFLMPGCCGRRRRFRGRGRRGPPNFDR